MGALGLAIDRRPALPCSAQCAAALSIFVRDPGCRVLAVADGQRPVGLVCREVFMARMEAWGATERPIVEAMEPDPLTAEVDEDADGFIQRAAATRPLALQHGFVVTEAGA